MKESPEGPAVASVSVPPGAAWDGWRGCQELLQAMSKHSSAGRLQSAAVATQRCEPGHAVPARQPAGPSALHGERAQPGAVPSLRDPAVPTGPAGGFAARSEHTRTRLEGLLPALRTHRPGWRVWFAARPDPASRLHPAGSALRTHRAGLTSPAGRRGCGRTWRGCTARSSSRG